MAKLMQALGYDVGHETIGQHGISSWLWAADSPTVPSGAPRNRAHAGHTIQVVRHPWMVISSLVSTSMPSAVLEEYIARFTYFPYGSPFRQAVHFVSNWNKLVQARNPDLVVKVEEADTVLPAWLAGLGYPIPASWDPPPKDYNSRDYSTELPISTLNEIPAWEQQLLMVHARHYGYEILQI